MTLKELEREVLDEIRAKPVKSDSDRLLLVYVDRFEKEIAALRAELAEHLETILHSEGLLVPFPRDNAGWWDTAANSDAFGAGERLVELGLYEKQPGGVGRRQFYRKVQNA